jgi:hypothetical protein
MLTTIPFSGFYESLHDSELDNALGYMFADYATGCDVNEDLHYKAHNLIHWGDAHKAYAHRYAGAFADHFAIPSLEFESLSSPKEYNFTTDRIFCTIERADLCRIMATFDLQKFAEYVREKFTSRDGFISFYSANLADWGNVESWDHNQCGTALEFYANQESGSGEFDQWEEYALLEDDRCNGVTDTILCDNAAPELDRLLKIHSYLEARAERAAA